MSIFALDNETLKEKKSSIHRYRNRSTAKSLAKNYRYFGREKRRVGAIHPKDCGSKRVPDHFYWCRNE